MERKEKLGKDFKRVQNKVNEIKGEPRRYDLNLLSIEEYTNKLYTNEMNDDEVKNQIGEPLYHFIRNKVNEYNGNNERFKIDKQCIDKLAESTIMLEFSENDERKKKLGELYPFVQNKVNEKLGCPTRHDESKKPWYLSLE